MFGFHPELYCSDRSRFQLFGDTVNTAARMESTGIKNHIQLSQTTADLLVAAGMNHWIVPRDEVVCAKGKGEMKTYWALHHEQALRRASSSSIVNDEEMIDFSESSSTGDCSTDDNFILALPPSMSRSVKNNRLIDWHVEMLTKMLKKIVAQRGKAESTIDRDCTMTLQNLGATPYDEVVEAIVLPNCTGKHNTGQLDIDSVQLAPNVVSQLRSVITKIANMYRYDSFSSCIG